MKEFNVIAFQKVLNNPLDESKGFKVERCKFFRGLTNFRTAIICFDKECPNWWYFNVYARPSGNYLGRVYTNTRRWEHFKR